VLRFDRHKHALVEEEDGQFLVRADLCDTFHEMAVFLRVDGASRVILEARAQMLRVPYRPCLAVESALACLVGEAVAPGVGKKVKAGVGGPGGCLHLSDLTMDALRSFLLAVRSAQGVLEMTPAERYRANYEELKGTCRTFSREPEGEL
jgi:hypothetical protein